MLDTFKHKGLRRIMTSNLEEKGITNESLLEAMNIVPRHWFLESAFLEFSYGDKPFPNSANFSISLPFVIASQLSLLDIKPGDKVLEIGTGVGYQTALLCEMKAKVFSVEKNKSIFEKTCGLFGKLKYNPKIFYAKDYDMLEKFAPFNKIIVSETLEYFPIVLQQQLAIGGKMIVSICNENETETKFITRRSARKYDVTLLAQ